MGLMDEGYMKRIYFFHNSCFPLTLASLERERGIIKEVCYAFIWKNKYIVTLLCSFK